MRLSIGRWDIEFNTDALRGIRDYRRYTSETGTHRVWWRFSLKIDDATIEAYRVCGECGADELGNVPCGDGDYLTSCGACRTVEGNIKYLNKREYEAEYE